MTDGKMMTVLVDDESGVAVETVVSQVVAAGGLIRERMDEVGILVIEATEKALGQIAKAEGVVLLER